jgi:hypothetical protein
MAGRACPPACSCKKHQPKAPETVAAIAAALRGRHVSAATRANISAAQREVWRQRTPEMRAAMHAKLHTKATTAQDGPHPVITPRPSWPRRLIAWLSW